MPSAIDICNMALSEGGTRSAIASFDEGSVEATNCGIWYDHMRKVLLRAAPWGFARKTAALSPLGDYTTSPPGSPYPWPYKYTYPSDCLAAHYVMWPPALDANGNSAWGAYSPGPSRANRFIIANDVDGVGTQRKVLLSTVQNALAVYTVDVADPNIFDPGFIEALVAALAFKLVIPLSGNVGMRGDFRQTAADAITAARLQDGNEAQPSTEHVPDWIAARSDGWACGDGINLSSLGYWYVGYDSVNWGM